MVNTIYAKDPVKFVPALAEALKGMEEFEVPEWATFTKSGVSRERPPTSDDFWYTRAASILRQLYIKGVVGVGRLRSRYGSKQDRGGKGSKFKKSGGKIIRVILQQAELAGLVEKVLRVQHGRRLTAKGRELLDSIEVETKDGLNFETVKTNPVEFVQEDVLESQEGEGKEVVEGVSDGE
ncbi:40S ribosomal protein S19 [Candidatus Pacearchaeota archaeon]|nr:40S ribosomal protein S19 [Candidatus Pacearchaeota archaeon]